MQNFEWALKRTFGAIVLVIVSEWVLAFGAAFADGSIVINGRGRQPPQMPTLNSTETGELGANSFSGTVDIDDSLPSEDLESYFLGSFAVTADEVDYFVDRANRVVTFTNPSTSLSEDVAFEDVIRFLDITP
jgi:hypothetical protein